MISGLLYGLLSISAYHPCQIPRVGHQPERSSIANPENVRILNLDQEVVKDLQVLLLSADIPWNVKFERKSRLLTCWKGAVTVPFFVSQPSYVTNLLWADEVLKSYPAIKGGRETDILENKGRAESHDIVRVPGGGSCHFSAMKCQVGAKLALGGALGDLGLLGGGVRSSCSDGQRLTRALASLSGEANSVFCREGGALGIVSSGGGSRERQKAEYSPAPERASCPFGGCNSRIGRAPLGAKIGLTVLLALVTGWIVFRGVAALMQRESRVLSGLLNLAAGALVFAAAMALWW